MSMSMRIRSRKAIAVLLSLAMLASCMVFSFGAGAAMTLMWENDFDNPTENNWHSVLKGESGVGPYNSGTYVPGQYASANYAVYKEEGYMALGFKTWESRNYLSGFTVRHKEATSKGVYGVYGAGEGAAYDVDTAVGHFQPAAGKYKVELDYKLNNIPDDKSSIIEICVGFADAETFYWDGDKNMDIFTARNGEYHTVATVTLADLGMAWKSIVSYIDLDGDAEKSMHIFVKTGFADGSLTNAEVLIDNVKISRYDGVLDLPTDPTLVSTKMWSNSFDNGTADNWNYYFNGEYSADKGANWHVNFHTGNKAGHAATLTDGAMEIAYTANDGEGYVAGFHVLHEDTTHSVAGQTGYGGHHAGNAKGDFRPKDGKYAILLDYKVTSFSETTASSVNVNVGYAKFSSFYFDGAKTLGNFENSTNLGVYDTAVTVDHSSISDEWRTAAAYLDVTAEADGFVPGLYVFANVVNNESDNTDCKVLIDNIRVYKINDDAVLPTVSYYYNGTFAGQSEGGLPGAPLTMPTLTGVPEGVDFSYFSDEACTKAMDKLTEYPNASVSVYLKYVPAESTTALEIPDGKQAVYECRITDAGSVSLVKSDTVCGLFSLSNGALTVLDRTVGGTYGAGTYTVHVFVNPVQDMVSAEIVLPDGGILRRGNGEIIENDLADAKIYATADAEANLNDIKIAYKDVTLNEYEDPRYSDEPVYTGFDADVYNLNTSFDGDAKTTRNFAFTTVEGYALGTGMSLQYRVKGASAWTTVAAQPVVEVAENTAEDHYKVDVTGLTPNIEYEYRIGKTGSTAADEWGSVYTFKTEAESVSDFSFVVYGDPQARQYWNFKDNPSVAASMEYKRFADTKTLLDEAFEDEPNPAFLLNTGDIVDGGEKTSWWKLFFKALGDYGKTTPHFSVVGNHDAQYIDNTNKLGIPFNYYFNHPNNGGNAALDPAYTSQMTTAGGKGLITQSDEMIYSYNYGNAHFIVLNTGDNSTADLEYLQKAQRKWLIKDLEANKDAKWTILSLHRPVYSPQATSYEWLKDVIEGYDIDLVIQAHDHVYGRSYPMKDGKIVTKTNTDLIEQGTGTVYTMLTATCAWNTDFRNNAENYATIIAFEDNDPNATYAVIDISDDELVMTTKNINGLVLDSFTITANDRSTVSFYDGDTVLGHTVGNAGEPFTMPTLSGIPTNAQLKYYLDKNCAQEIDLPSVYPTSSMNIYVLGVLAPSVPWSFETEADGTHISAKSNIYQGGTRTISSDYARTGAHSLKMYNENGEVDGEGATVGNARRNQFVLKDGDGNYAQVQAGKSYLLTYWIYVPEDAMYDYQGNLWLAGIGDSTAGFNNSDWVNTAFFDDGSEGYVTVKKGSGWQQVTRYIDGSTITVDNDGNVLVGLTHMVSETSNTFCVYLDDIQLTCTTDLVTGGYAGNSDRVVYMYDATLEDGSRTHLHTSTVDGTGTYTSVRLGATYTAGSEKGDTIILSGVEYPLLERGIIVDEAVNKNTLDIVDPLYSSSKTKDFYQCWEGSKSSSTVTDGAMDYTFTLRLANISENRVEAGVKYVYRSYYKISVPYYVKGSADVQESEILVYGNISDEFSFLDIYNKATDNGTKGGDWFW